MTRPADSALARATPTELRRLARTDVAYMELAATAGAFSCGACVHRAGTAASPTCANPAIRAPISAKHGCCNLYWPRGRKPVFNAAAVRARFQ